MLDDAAMASIARRRMLAAVVGAILVGLLGWFGWWWTHPSLLADTSLLGNGRFAPRPVEQATAHVNVAIGPESDEVITLHAVEARFKINTAKATATFQICEARPGVTPIGSVGDTKPLSAFCTRLRPVTNGARFHFSKAHEQLKEYIVLTIAPTVPGTAIVDQISFDYERSWSHLGQRGTDTSAQYWSIRAT